MNKKLYRIRDRQVIGGVCTGLADYFEIDVVIMRIIMISLVIINFAGVFLYILLWIMVPYGLKSEKIIMNDPNQQLDDNNPNPDQNTLFSDLQEKDQPNRRSFLGGLLLIALGIAFMLDEWIDFLSSQFFWPSLLILIGAALVINSRLSSKAKREETL